MPIRDATNLWIQAGAMSGGPRHQTEFSDELALFFDDNTRGNELIYILLPDSSIHLRPFTYRGDEHHWTQIWRVSLPTTDMGGPSYQNRIIKFTKNRIGNSCLYRIDVADESSAEVSSWEAEAQARGYIGTTGASGAGRRYGWW